MDDPKTLDATRTVVVCTTEVVPCLWQEQLTNEGAIIRKVDSLGHIYNATMNSSRYKNVGTKLQIFN